MPEPVIEIRSDTAANLFFKGRLWRRTEHSGRIVWVEVVWVNNMPCEPSVSDKAARILEETYKSSDSIKIRRFPRPLAEADAVPKEHLRKTPAASKAKDQAGSQTTRSIENDTADVVKRTKWGTRVYSNDRRYYFTVGVWTSTKYAGCSSVRFCVAGRTCLYTLDKTQMEALRREISRGEPT